MSGQYEFAFKEALKAVRRNMSPAQRKKRPAPTIWLYPIAIEKRYYQLIRQYVRDPLVKAVNIWVENDLPRLLRQKPVLDQEEWELVKKDAWKSNTQSILDCNRIDSWIDEVETFIRSLRNESEKITGEEKQSTDSAWILLGLIFAATYFFNKKQFNKTTQSVLGFPFQTQDPWMDDLKKAWSAENYNLIKGLSDEYISKINTIVWDGFRGGLSQKEIAKQIKEIDANLFGPKFKTDPTTGRKRKAQSRAELIARDQVGKLNGELTKRHMQDIGADIYEWNTAQDERVRGRPGGKYPRAIPSHWAMQGKLCKWSDNSVYAEKGNKIVWIDRTSLMPTGIPGSAIQCRCTGLTWWDEMLDEIDAEIMAA